MRTPSTAAIIVLCTVVLLVDAFAFYWLQSITEWIDSALIKQLINILFWAFSAGLITAILLLKLRIEHLHPLRKQWFTSSLYGLIVSSIVPKFIFVVIISLIYYSSSVITQQQATVWAALAGLFSGVLPFSVVLYGIFRTLYRFKVHHIELPLKNLPREFDGLRIVQISDLHLGSFNRKYHILERAVEMINKLEPDLILFTGDLVNNYAWELKGWASVLGKLKAKKGKFSVLGNHDYGDYSKWKSRDAKRANLESIHFFYRKIGFELLLNDARILHAGDAQLAIVGVENWGRPPFQQHGDLDLALREVGEVPFKILLTHDPSHWTEEVIDQTDIALSFSGHTHGMQAGVKFGKKEWSPIKYRYKQWAGLYEIHGQYLYVNRGLGWLGFPGRLGVRPEISLVVLHSESASD